MRVRLDPILVVCWLCAFVPILDTNIVNLALPRIGMAFGTSASELAWVVTAYVIPFAVSILAVGRLGDSVGRRRVLLAASLLFAIASLVCAAAPSYALLLGGRVVQGIAGSALITTALGYISASYTGLARARAIGIFFTGGSFGGMVGPVLGGVLTSLLTWRGMFALQIPLALVALVLVYVLVAPQERHARAIDVPGLAAASFMLLGINVALLEAHAFGWTSPLILGAWTTAAAAFVLFIARERTASAPAVDLAVFRKRSFVAASLAGAAMWFGLISITIQLALYLQAGRGLDPTAAALVLTPGPAAAFLLFPRVARIVARFGQRETMVAGLGLSAAFLFLMLALDPSVELWLLALLSMPLNAAMSLVLVTSASGAVAEFAPQDAGAASGVFNSIRQLGTSLGVAVPAVVYDMVTGGALMGPDAVSGARWALLVTALVFATVTLVAAALTAPRRSPQEARSSPSPTT